MADFGASRRFERAEAEEREADEDDPAGLVLTMTMVGTPMYCE